MPGILRPAAVLAACAVLLVAACSEQPLPPELPLESPTGSVDSTQMATQARPRPHGLFLAPVASDSLVLTASTDSFRISLVDRECAAPSNSVSLLSPASALLSAAMCQAPIDTTWSFVGPYASGTGIVLEFTSGAFGGSFDGQIQISGGFPTWTLNFEDAGDNDFNDFILDVQAFSPDTLFSISLSADTTELHPWIDSTTFRTVDTLFVQDDRVGDSVSVTVTASIGGSPSPGASVVVTAELVPGAGGHSHQADRLSFGDLPTFSYAAGDPRPIGGFFKQGSTRSDSIVTTTDSLGQVSFRFIAGFLGGRIDLAVHASLGGAEAADTVELTVKVPGLVDLVTQGSLGDSVYFIGPKAPHRSDSTWYAQPSLASALQTLVHQISRPAASQYLRLNDTSLPMGGSFSLEENLFEVSTGNEVDRPGVSHRSHGYGVDIDVSVCFSETNGKQTGFINPSCGSSSVDRNELARIARSAGLIVIVEGSPPHYHLRLSGETLRMPL